MNVKKLKELIKDWPDDAIISKWDDDTESINSEIEEIDYLYTATETKGDDIKIHIILG